jgi:hypothetical protein
MGREDDGLQLARLVYGFAAVILLVVAVGAVALEVTGASGGCQIVLSLGPAPALGPAVVGPGPQPAPGPSASGVPSACAQYVDVAPPLVGVVLGVILLVTAIRLGREPRFWGPSIAVGAIAGIAAALGTAYLIVGISTSDQPQPSPAPGVLLIAAIPVLAALASTLAVWRARQRGPEATSGQANASIPAGGAATTRMAVRIGLVIAFVLAELFYLFFEFVITVGPAGAPGVGGVGDRAAWVPTVLGDEMFTLLPVGFILCLWGSTWGRRLALVCAAASIALALAASVAMAGGGSVGTPFGTPLGFGLLAIPGVTLIVFVRLMQRASARSQNS